MDYGHLAVSQRNDAFSVTHLPFLSQCAGDVASVGQLLHIAPGAVTSRNAVQRRQLDQLQFLAHRLRRHRRIACRDMQRQRIALARAFLKDAPILVLDEATSALDSEVEASIQEALGRVMQGKTVLAIAHRLSTIAAMDRIIVMEQGRIVEQGDHAGLLAKGGVYARYWNRQSGGFIGTDEDDT